MWGEEQYHKSKFISHEAALPALLNGLDPGAVVGGGDNGNMEIDGITCSLTKPILWYTNLFIFNQIQRITVTVFFQKKKKLYILINYIQMVWVLVKQIEEYRDIELSIHFLIILKPASGEITARWSLVFTHVHLTQTSCDFHRLKNTLIAHKWGSRLKGNSHQSLKESAA